MGIAWSHQNNEGLLIVELPIHRYSPMADKDEVNVPVAASIPKKAIAVTPVPTTTAVQEPKKTEQQMSLNFSMIYTSSLVQTTAARLDSVKRWLKS